MTRLHYQLTEEVMISFQNLANGWKFIHFELQCNSLDVNACSSSLIYAIIGGLINCPFRVKWDVPMIIDISRLVIQVIPLVYQWMIEHMFQLLSLTFISYLFCSLVFWRLYHQILNMHVLLKLIKCALGNLIKHL